MIIIIVTIFAKDFALVEMIITWLSDSIILSKLIIEETTYVLLKCSTINIHANSFV